MKNTSDNPFSVFIDQQIKQFAGEVKRLRDRQPLVDYKALVDTFIFIVEKLGTVEHEVALAKLSSEFKLASTESADAWNQIWRDFKHQRRRAIQTERTFAEHSQQTKTQLADLEQSFSEITTEDEDLRQSMRSCIDAAKRASKIGNEFESGLRKAPWLFLWVDLHSYSVYLRYIIAKLGFFLFRHGFIFLTSILILGIVYSQLTKALIEHFVALAPQWSWFAAALTLGAYVFKKYYFDPKLKKVQIKLETKCLRPLAFQLHIVRTMALMSRTHRREASSCLKT